MPLLYGKDTQGCWVKWGKSGAKYHYQCSNAQSRDAARQKALRQARAIEANRG